MRTIAALQAMMADAAWMIVGTFPYTFCHMLQICPEGPNGIVENNHATTTEDRVTLEPPALAVRVQRSDLAMKGLSPVSKSDWEQDRVTRSKSLAWARFVPFILLRC